VKKVIVKRRWFWWIVTVYSGYQLGAPIEYVYPKRFFRKSAAKMMAKNIRFNE